MTVKVSNLKTFYKKTSEKKIALIVSLVLCCVIASGNILVLFIGYQIYSDVIVEDNHKIILPFLILVEDSISSIHPFLLIVSVLFFIVILFTPIVWTFIKSIVLISKY